MLFYCLPHSSSEPNNRNPIPSLPPVSLCPCRQQQLPVGRCLTDTRHTPFTSLTPLSRGTGSLPPTYHTFCSGPSTAITTWHPSHLYHPLVCIGSTIAPTSQAQSSSIIPVPSLLFQFHPVPLSWVKSLGSASIDQETQIPHSPASTGHQSNKRWRLLTSW